MVSLVRKGVGSALTMEDRLVIMEVLRVRIVVGFHRKSVPKT